MIVLARRLDVVPPNSPTLADHARLADAIGHAGRSAGVDTDHIHVSAPGGQVLVVLFLPGLAPPPSESLESVIRQGVEDAGMSGRLTLASVDATS